MLPSIANWGINMCELVQNYPILKDYCEKFTNTVTSEENRPILVLVATTALALTVFAVLKQTKWRWSAEKSPAPLPLPVKVASASPSPPPEQPTPTSTPAEPEDNEAPPPPEQSSPTTASTNAELEVTVTPALESAPPQSIPELMEQADFAFLEGDWDAGMALLKLAAEKGSSDAKKRHAELLTANQAPMIQPPVKARAVEKKSAPAAAQPVMVSTPASPPPSAVQKASISSNAEWGQKYLERAREAKSAWKLPEARDLFKRAADYGSPEAALRYAEMVLDDGIGKTNFVEAKEYLLQSTTSSAEDSIRSEAHFQIYQSRIPFKLNRYEEEAHLKAAVELGNASAMLVLAQRAYHMCNTKNDIPSARKYYEMAIARGDRKVVLESRFCLAEMERRIENGDLIKARENYKIVADERGRDHVEAALFYAQMVDQGHGGEKDPVESSKYYSIYLNNTKFHTPKVMYRYAEIQYELGEYATAREYFRKAWQPGSSSREVFFYLENYQAALRYAEMAYNGIGGPKDLEEARSYYARAANGIEEYVQPKAMFRLAQMMQKGEGGKKERKEAERFFEKAKQLGYTRSI